MEMDILYIVVLDWICILDVTLNNLQNFDWNNME